MTAYEFTLDTSGVDTNERILDDVSQAITRLSAASEEQFQEIKKEKWFHRLWDMVTLSSKKEVRMAEQISTLAQAQEGLVNILVVLSAQNQEISDLVRDNMESVRKLQKNDIYLLNRLKTLENSVYGFTKGYNLSKLSEKEKAILNSCLYYLSRQFQLPSANQQNYDNGIQLLLNNDDTRTAGVDFTKESLKKLLPNIEKTEVKKCILRCCLEYIYLYRLDADDFNGDICSELINLFDVGQQTVDETEQLVIETVTRIGAANLVDKYRAFSVDKTFVMELDLDPMAGELPEDRAVQQEPVPVQLHEFPEIEACIKKFTQATEHPLGKTREVTGNLVAKLFPDPGNRPVLKTVKAITRTSKAHMVFTTYAMYYVEGKAISRIPYAQVSPKDIIISSENGSPVLCFEQFRLAEAGFQAETLKEFLVMASGISDKPASDRLADAFDSLGLDIRIGYFRIMALLVWKAGYPLHEVYRFAAGEKMAGQWPMISANLQTASPEEEIDAWKAHICYPNEEFLQKSLLEEVCRVQMRTSGKDGLSHEDERYYTAILPDGKGVSEKKMAVITSEKENSRCMDGSDNGPTWKRYETIKKRISHYELAIETARQAGEDGVREGLEEALDGLKRRTCFSTLNAPSQEQLIERIRDFLIADKVNARLAETLTPKEQAKMLMQMSPKGATIPADDVIGIYNPSIGDIITNSFSGILFAKDVCYVDWRTKAPVCIPYALIDSATDPNTGQGLKMAVTLKGNGDKKHSKITLDGLSMATPELKSLFSDMVKIYKENA